MIGSQDVICKNIEFYFNLGVQVFKKRYCLLNVPRLHACSVGLINRMKSSTKTPFLKCNNNVQRRYF